MSARDEVFETLRQHRFVLVRSNGHDVWRNPAGLTHVTPCSISDSLHGWDNNLRSLHRLIAAGERHIQRALKITKRERDHADRILRDSNRSNRRHA